VGRSVHAAGGGGGYNMDAIIRRIVVCLLVDVVWWMSYAWWSGEGVCKKDDRKDGQTDNESKSKSIESNVHIATPP